MNPKPGMFFQMIVIYSVWVKRQEGTFLRELSLYRGISDRISIFMASLNSTICH